MAVAARAAEEEEEKERRREEEGARERKAVAERVSRSMRVQNSSRREGGVMWWGERGLGVRRGVWGLGCVSAGREMEEGGGRSRSIDCVLPAAMRWTRFTRGLVASLAVACGWGGWVGGCVRRCVVVVMKA